MRHNKKFNHLGRTSSHRKAMLANLASSLIESKRINTTVAKAKALRTYVEPLITKAKDDTTHSRRVVFSHLQNKNAVSELFRDVAAKIADRPGGYTRILRTGNRLGDNAEMCIIELVDYNETMLTSGEEAAKSKRRRSRRGGAKKTEATVAGKDKQVKSKTKKETAAAEGTKSAKADQPVKETKETTEAKVDEEKTSVTANDEETDVAELEEKAGQEPASDGKSESDDATDEKKQE
jgi:large subunit ribosomal protein L17